MKQTIDQEGVMFDKIWLRGFIERVNSYNPSQLFAEAESALDHFKEEGASLQAEWQKGRALRGLEGRAPWVALYCLAWAFCKASQLYRLRAAFEKDFRRRNPSNLTQYERLTAEFARYAQALHEEAVGAGASIPKREWALIDGVRERATQRSIASAQQSDESETKQKVMRRLATASLEF